MFHQSRPKNIEWLSDILFCLELHYHGQRSLSSHLLSCHFWPTGLALVLWSGDAPIHSTCCIHAFQFALQCSRQDIRSAQCWLLGMWHWEWEWITNWWSWDMYLGKYMTVSHAWTREWKLWTSISTCRLLIGATVFVYGHTGSFTTPLKHLDWTTFLFTREMKWFFGISCSGQKCPLAHQGFRKTWCILSHDQFKLPILYL